LFIAGREINMSYKTKAVVLGNNYYIGLSAIRSLGIHGVPVVAMDYSDKDTYGAKSKYVSEKYIVPHYRDEKEAFIEALIDFAKKEDNKPVLIPCHDSYVEVIDEYLDILINYYLIPQQSQGIYTQAMNKDTLHNLALEHRVKVPEIIQTDEENFYDRVEKELGFPCLVKPVDSPTFVDYFRKKLFIVENRSELKDAIEKSTKAQLDVFAQRIIPGFDDHMHTYDAYVNQEGVVTHWTTAQKFRQYPINFGASVYTVQKAFPELHEIGAPFLENMGFKGFAEIEFKKDENTGDFYLIEINVRITNFNEMLRKVGLNFPYITYKELIGEPLEAKAIDYTTNIAFRYLFEDLLAIKDYIKSKQLGLFSILKTLLKRKAGAIWSWRDPLPGFSFTFMMIKKFFNRLFKR